MIMVLDYYNLIQFYYAINTRTMSYNNFDSNTPFLFFLVVIFTIFTETEELTKLLEIQ
jgi:hypothetical protein